MLRNATGEFIALVKQALGVVTDAELAEMIGTGKSTIGSWRIRDHIPEKKRKQIEKLSGISFEKIDAECNANDALVLPLMRIAYLSAAAIVFNQASPHDLNRIVSHIVTNEHDLLQSIATRISDAVEGKSLSEQDILALAQQAYACKFMSAAEMMGWVAVEDSSSNGSSK